MEKSNLYKITECKEVVAIWQSGVSLIEQVMRIE